MEVKSWLDASHLPARRDGLRGTWRKNESEEEKVMDDANMILWNELKKHRGHKVDIVSYGDWDNPANVCLECEDCGEVVLGAGIYTLCARKDI